MSSQAEALPVAVISSPVSCSGDVMYISANTQHPRMFFYLAGRGCNSSTPSHLPPHLMANLQGQMPLCTRMVQSPWCSVRRGSLHSFGVWLLWCWWYVFCLRELSLRDDKQKKSKEVYRKRHSANRTPKQGQWSGTCGQECVWLDDIPRICWQQVAT